VIQLIREPAYPLRHGLRNGPHLQKCPNLNFELALEQTHALHVYGHCPGNSKMLTILAMLAAPVLVTTIVLIVVFEIKEAWDRNRLR